MPTKEAHPCTSCGKPQHRSSHGLCITCYERARRKADPEYRQRRQEYIRQYQKAHPEKRREWERTYNRKRRAQTLLFRATIASKKALEAWDKYHRYRKEHTHD